MAQPTAAPKEARASRPYVTVACKIAVGWIDLKIYEEGTAEEQTQTGPRTIKVFKPTGEMIRIRGTAFPRGEPPEGYPDKPRMVEGCALTTVPRNLWDKYINQCRVPAPFIQSGMIFAFESLDDIKDCAKEHSAEKSGLEPVQRKGKELNDPRIHKPTMKEVAPLQPDHQRMAERQPG